MSRGNWAILLLVASIPSLTLGSTHSTLSLDDLEAETSSVLNSTLTQWDVVSGSIDVLPPGNACGLAGNPNACIDPGGTGPVGGAIRTQSQFTLLSDNPFLIFQRGEFDASSPVALRLAFAHHGMDKFGLLLDNVRFGRVDCRPGHESDPMSEVPEPATLLLVGSGLILTFWRIRRAR